MKLSTGGYEIFVCEHREGVKYYLVFFSVTPHIRQIISTKNNFLKGEGNPSIPSYFLGPPASPAKKSIVFETLPNDGWCEREISFGRQQRHKVTKRQNGKSYFPQNPDKGKQARGSKRDFSNQRHSQSYSVKITLVFLIGQIHELKVSDLLLYV